MDPVPNLISWCARTSLGKPRHSSQKAYARPAVNLMDFDWLLVLAIALYEKGDYSLTTSLLERALRIRPKDAVACSSLAWLHFQRANFARAASIWRSCLGVAPDESQALCGLGLCHLELNDLGQAVARFTDAVRLDPNNPLSWRLLAQTHRRFGETRQACECLSRATELGG